MPVLQITFSMCAPIPWDKAPNLNGQKSMACDPTGVVRKDKDRWDADLGSIAHQFFALAMHQGLICPADLEGLRIGDMFTIPDLIARRQDASAAHDATLAEQMCGYPLCTVRGCESV